MIKDGWHTIKFQDEILEITKEYDVYVENGIVLRGTKKDSNGNDVPAYPYRSCRNGGWDNCTGEVKYENFRRGLKTGRYNLC